MPKLKIVVDPSQFDQSHGSPFDRGSADKYYGQPPKPHKWLDGAGCVVVTDLTDFEIAAYECGYNTETESKVW